MQENTNLKIETIIASMHHFLLFQQLYNFNLIEDLALAELDRVVPVVALLVSVEPALPFVAVGLAVVLLVAAPSVAEPSSALEPLPLQHV